MASNETGGGIDVTVSSFVLKLAAVAVGLLVLGFVVAQTLPENAFTGVFVGMLYSTGGLMLAVVLFGVVGDVVSQLRRRR